MGRLEEKTKISTLIESYTINSPDFGTYANKDANNIIRTCITCRNIRDVQAHNSRA
ncbi:hypothetical protein ACTXT7_012638, partial [Hymenolepis weldensis]